MTKAEVARGKNHSHNGLAHSNSNCAGSRSMRVDAQAFLDMKQENLHLKEKCKILEETLTTVMICKFIGCA